MMVYVTFGKHHLFLPVGLGLILHLNLEAHLIGLRLGSDIIRAYRFVSG